MSNMYHANTKKNGVAILISKKNQYVANIRE